MTGGLREFREGGRPGAIGPWPQMSRQSSSGNSALPSSMSSIPGYDSVLVYTFPPGATPYHDEWGTPQTAPDDIL